MRVLGDNLRTPFTGGAEALTAGQTDTERRFGEGRVRKYRAVSAGCASKLVARSVGFVSGVCAPTLFDIVTKLKRYEGGLVHFDEQTPAYLALRVRLIIELQQLHCLDGFLFSYENLKHNKQFEFIRISLLMRCAEVRTSRISW